MKQWQGIVIHHSATPDGKVLSDFEAIKKYHIEVNGWKDIGYHYVIEQVDSKYIIRIGRNINEAGAHALGYNATHIGICCVGNYDLIEPSIELYNTLKNLLIILKNTYDIVNTDIIGHRDTYLLRKVLIEKTCPGKLFEISKVL